MVYPVIAIIVAAVASFNLLSFLAGLASAVFSRQSGTSFTTDQQPLEGQICQIYRDWLGVMIPPFVPTLYEAFDIPPTASKFETWQAVERKLADTGASGTTGDLVTDSKLAREDLTESQVWIQMGNIVLDAKLRGIYDATFQPLLSQSPQHERRQHMKKRCKWRD